MQAGREEIGVEEQLRPGRVQRERRPDPRHQALAVFEVILGSLDADEDQPEDSGDREVDDRIPATALTRRRDRQRHRQAAGQQHGGVDPAEALVEMRAGFTHRLRIEHPVDGDGEEQAAEQHQLGGEKRPHAEERGFPLLLGRRELFGDRFRHQVPSRNGYW